ncbi:sugar transferase [Armatimonas rosea]|uniref:Exopolysaccharide biosynthesis polyprenyl glycosylphosphotransferase n=1 Tax=Armatimonas rosea TaxID=685828 RepID=A0A7W9SUN9_ARMRO|nr:sugar transferase [Armatimonas rosea]MBB6053165.1 exopolysaccharide biosynthesis polyprenyl glycosylphosphotransferase [Armatimonas rosea]
MSQPDSPISENVFQKSEPSSSRQRVLIVGTGFVARSLATEIAANTKFEVVGFVDEGGVALDSCEWPVLGSKDDILEISTQYAIDDIFIAYSPTWQQKLLDETLIQKKDINIHILPSSYDIILASSTLYNLGEFGILRITETKNKISDTVKRFFDITIALLSIILLSPVIIAIAFIIKVTSRGPILFTQVRVGKHNNCFTLLKFRTMHVDAENNTGPVLSSGKADARLTLVGRWLRLVRLDEIPQLINVLRGEMSIVGPRPERPFFVDKFVAHTPTYNYRHQVRPGITGLAQVYGNYHTDAREKLRFDLFYITHRSLILDITIILKTLQYMIFKPNGC